LLLADAVALAKTSTAAILTNDSDFTGFVEDIRKRFDVRIIDLSRLPDDKKTIDTLLQSL
jgi:hypothetical protein